MNVKEQLHKLMIEEGLKNKPKAKSIAYKPKIKGTILAEWNGNKLKNKGKLNMHHYRRNGLLYVVLKTSKGIVHEVNTSVRYETIENSTCAMTSRMSKHSNHKLSMELDKNFMTYQEYNKTL